MFKNISTPPSFSLIKRGKIFLLLRDEYKDFLLQQGIEDLETFLLRHRETSKYLTGRALHPSIPIKNGERMVLRQYSHGGLLRFFTRKFYLLGSRSFRELALTEEILSCGIPTIQPIGAIHRFILPPLYKAYLLSLELPRAMDLMQFIREIGSQPSSENLHLKRKTIRSAGLLLRQFHKSGFYHADLQLKNILIAGDQLFLIDFDRSYRKEILTMKERMKNILRLNRSVEKWKRLGLPITRRDRLRFFLAYAGDDLKVREALGKTLPTFSIKLFFHQLRWKLSQNTKQN
jgi:serine/threonine protein kinase